MTFSPRPSCELNILNRGLGDFNVLASSPAEPTEIPLSGARQAVLEAIGKILDCLGLPSRAPPVAPAMREFLPPIQPS